MDQVAPQKFNLWHRLGFGQPPAPGVPHIEGMAEGGHLLTTQIQLGAADRMRVLLSGKLMTRTVLKTPQPIEKSVGVSITNVLPPGTPAINVRP